MDQLTFLSTMPKARHPVM